MSSARKWLNPFFLLGNQLSNQRVDGESSSRTEAEREEGIGLLYLLSLNF